MIQGWTKIIFLVKRWFVWWLLGSKYKMSTIWENFHKNVFDWKTYFCLGIWFWWSQGDKIAKLGQHISKNKKRKTKTNRLIFFWGEWGCPRTNEDNQKIGQTRLNRNRILTKLGPFLKSNFQGHGNTPRGWKSKKIKKNKTNHKEWKINFVISWSSIWKLH